MKTTIDHSARVRDDERRDCRADHDPAIRYERQPDRNGGRNRQQDDLLPSTHGKKTGTTTLPGRDMTCRGPLELRANGGLHRDVGVCFTNDEASAAIIDAACEVGKPCVLRVRAAKRDTPHGVPQTYNVLKVYSARRP